VDIQETIAWAKKTMDEDPHLANYGLRDCQEVKDAGLNDLVWSMHRGNVHRNDVVFLIEKLEAHLEARQ